ncbi:hypothetical protein [Streptomyces sp. NPDC004629]|uniref:hypothetical protein n=1 Tax=Streptomyces sp. NPDC004629 TaxID=3364705 RepID=UPI0036853542
MGWLSWPAGRRGRGRHGDGARGHAAAQAPETGRAPVRAAEWREVPPLQRTVGAPDLVTNPVGFRGSLDTWRDASLRIPLGHLVSPQAPSGLGHGLATPAAREETPAVGREVRADTARRARQSNPPVQREAESGTAGTGAAASVAPLVAARPPDMRVRRLTAVPVDAARPDPPVPLPSSPPSARPSPSPSAAPVQRAAAADRTRPHTFGLGEPLAELPFTARREDAAGAPPPSDEPGAVSPWPDSPSGDPTAGPLLFDDPLVVRTADTRPLPEPRSDGTPVRIQRAAADGTPAAPGPRPVSGPLAPLVAQRSVPLFSGVRPPDAGDASSEAGQQVVVPVRWSRPADGYRTEGTGAPAQGAPAGTTVDSVRSVPVPAAQRSVAPAAALPPRQAAARPAAAAVPRSPVPVDTGSVAVAAGVAQRMADGSVVFRPPSAAHMPPVAAAAPASPQPYASMPPTASVQRARAAASTEPGRSIRSVRFVPSVQRDVETTPPDPPAPLDPPVPPDLPDPPAPSSPDPVTGDSATAPAAPGEQTGEPGPGGPSKVDDALVRALFAPLSRLLKAELRLDRERAGHLINTRH